MTGSLFDTTAEDSILDRGRVDGLIYLMRHGHTVLDVDKRSDGWLDMPLSDKGRIGVIDAQQYLKTVPLECIYCPPLKRTTETAQIIKSGTMSDPEIEEATEAGTWNLGVLAGTKKSQGKPKVRQLMENPDQRPMGGESYNEFCARFVPWFEELMGEADEPVLYIGSGSNLRLIGQVVAGDMDALDLDEGGLAVLRLNGGKWYIEVILGEDDAGDQVS